MVYGHHPIYSDGKYGDDPALRDSLMPILRGRANLYISGHEHSLQHLTAEDGVHFVIAGGGGAGTYPDEAGATIAVRRQPEWIRRHRSRPQDAVGQPDRRRSEGVAPIHDRSRRDGGCRGARVSPLRSR